jgi:L-lysine 2,3-aminomutase
MKKTCTKCKIDKNIDQFRKRSKSKDGHESSCKDCRRAYDNSSYASNEDRKLQIRQSAARQRIARAKWYREILSERCCIDCGQNDPELIEFDHVSGKKVSGVAIMVHNGAPVSAIMEEIDKCVVRCLYCHRKKSIRTLGWYASLV